METKKKSKRHWHQFEHITEKSRCMNERCEEEHIFMIHRCYICGMKTSGERLY